MSQAAALRLARSIVDAAGQPVAGHGDLVRVPWSVRTVAAHADISAGTAQRYLRLLDDLGVRLDAETRLFSASRLDQLTAASAAPGPSGSSLASPVRSREDLEVPMDVAAGFAALCQLVAADRSQLAMAESTAAEWLRRFAVHSPVVGSPSESEVGMRDKVRDEPSVARPLRDEPDVAIARPAGRGSNRASSPIDGLIDESIGSSMVGKDSRESIGGESRSAQDLAGLLAPLTDACERLGLPGVSDSGELGRRLARFDDDQVRYAVNKLLVEANNGLRKPVGKLANVASERSRDYFPVDPPPVRLPGQTAIEPDVDDGLSDRGELVVAVPPADLSVSREGLTMVRASLDALRHDSGSS